MNSIQYAEEDARSAQAALQAAAEAAAEAERAAAVEEAEMDEALSTNDTTVAGVTSAVPASKLKQPTDSKNVNPSGIPKKIKPRP